MTKMIFFHAVIGLLLFAETSLTEVVPGGPGDATDDCSLIDSEVQDLLRNELKDKNCLPELEIVEPGDIKRAARLFFRDGFVVVKDAISDEQNTNLGNTCRKLAKDIMANDPKKVGNRGPKRWSLGSASKTGHLLHDPEWAKLIDLPTITPILKEIFGNDDYICRGARGDFNIPGAVYQPLHSDVSRSWLVDNSVTEYNNSGRLSYRDLPVFHVVVNYNIQDLNSLNAPIRQIPMTQRLQSPIPLLDDEPLWMKRSTLCPLPAGSAILRDPRAWHGGTPNLSDDMRCLANVEYYAYWYRFNKEKQTGRIMTREVYDGLTEFGKKISREILAHPGEVLDVGFLNDTTLLMSDHDACYRRLGLTDEDFQRYKDQGKYFDYSTQSDITREGFYGRLKSNTKQNKDEL